MQHVCTSCASSRSPSSALLPFLGVEGSPTKTDYRKKGTLILTSPLEDPVICPIQMVGGLVAKAIDDNVVPVLPARVLDWFLPSLFRYRLLQAGGPSFFLRGVIFEG